MDLSYFPLPQVTPGNNLNTLALSTILPGDDVKWKIRSILLNFVTGVAGANRVLGLSISSNGASLTWRFISSLVQTANQSVDYELGVGIIPTNFAYIAGVRNGLVLDGLPDMTMQGRVILATNIENLMAADQLTGGLIVAEQCKC